MFCDKVINSTIWLYFVFLDILLRLYSLCLIHSIFTSVGLGEGSEMFCDKVINSTSGRIPTSICLKRQCSALYFCSLDVQSSRAAKPRAVQHSEEQYAGRHTRMESKPFDPNRVQPHPLGSVDVVLILLLVDEQTPKDDSILTQVWFLAQVAQEGLHLNR